MARIIPLSGPESLRQLVADAGRLRANELHTTNDQKRAFLENVYLGPAVHMDVPDEASMLALNTDDSRGVWPADLCLRSDTDTLWVCLTNNGEAIGDWFELAAGGGAEMITVIDGGGAEAPTEGTIDGGGGSAPPDTIDGGTDPGY